MRRRIVNLALDGLALAASASYQGCIWYNVNSFFVRTTTSRHSASRACYAIILTVSDPILCNKSIYIIVKRNFLRDSAARYHLPPPARASSTDDPMTHLSRFSNGNATARFWQKVTTGLFKRRLHRVLTISDVIFLDISTIYITNITSSPCDKVIHDLSTSSWPHEHADPDAWHLYFPAEEKFT